MRGVARNRLEAERLRISAAMLPTIRAKAIETQIARTQLPRSQMLRCGACTGPWA